MIPINTQKLQIRMNIFSFEFNILGTHNNRLAEIRRFNGHIFDIWAVKSSSHKLRLALFTIAVYVLNNSGFP